MEGFYTKMVIRLTANVLINNIDCSLLKHGLHSNSLTFLGLVPDWCACCLNVYTTLYNLVGNKVFDLISALILRLTVQIGSKKDAMVEEVACCQKLRKHHNLTLDEMQAWLLEAFCCLPKKHISC